MNMDNNSRLLDLHIWGQKHVLHEDNLHYSIFLLLDQHSKTIAVVFNGHGLLSVLVTIDISYYKRDFLWQEQSRTF